MSSIPNLCVASKSRFQEAGLTEHEIQVLRIEESAYETRFPLRRINKTRVRTNSGQAWDQTQDRKRKAESNLLSLISAHSHLRRADIL
jgi:5-bromo-4-chloroindolyl phosphate hydrolysis protein